MPLVAATTFACKSKSSGNSIVVLICHKYAIPVAIYPRYLPTARRTGPFTPPTPPCNNCSTFSKRFTMFTNAIRHVLLLAICLLPVTAQAQVKMLRHPTYSKGKVAFSYLGDIWIANENGSNIVRL